MIYEGHAYCVPDQRGRMGFETRAEFMQYLQYGMAANFSRCGGSATVCRRRQRHVDPASGAASTHGESGFRPGGYGRTSGGKNGETHVRQVMPPTNVVNGYSAEQLVAEMDHADVDWALLHRSPYLGIGNEFVADCVRRFPGRLHALAHVEEWLVKGRWTGASPSWTTRQRSGSARSPVAGLHQVLVRPERPLGRPLFRPWWDAVAGMDIPVFFTGLGIPVEGGEGRDPLLEDLRSLGRWMDRYPDVTVVLTHGLNFRSFMTDDSLEIPGDVFDAAPLDSPNFNLQLLFVNNFGGDWDYPMPQIRSALLRMVERIGADHLAWGTDLPQNLRHYTYLQCIDSIRVNCADILGKMDID